MKISHRRIRLCFLALVFYFPATAADRAGALARLAAAVSQSQPTLTILPASTGASLRSYSAGSASLSLGQAAYYGGRPSPGVKQVKAASSMVLSTRFGLRVDCGTGPSSSAEVNISLAAMDPSYTVRVDGVKLLSTPSALMLQCGSTTEHVVEVEIPKTRPAGSLANALAFSVTPKY